MDDPTGPSGPRVKPRRDGPPFKKTPLPIVLEKMNLGIKLGRIADDLGVCRTTLWRRIKWWRARGLIPDKDECMDDEAAS